MLGCLGNLPPRQRAALGAAFGTADAAAAEPFLIALAALRLLTEAAARAPVVLAAEDAQWLDRPTAEVLAFIARRVPSDPVLLLTAIRDGYRSPLLDAGLAELHLEGLGEQLGLRAARRTPPAAAASAAARRVMAAARRQPAGPDRAARRARRDAGFWRDSAARRDGPGRAAAHPAA